MYNMQLFSVFGSATCTFIDYLPEDIQLSANFCTCLCAFVTACKWERLVGWSLPFTWFCGTDENHKGHSEHAAAMYCFLLVH